MNDFPYKIKVFKSYQTPPDLFFNENTPILPTAQIEFSPASSEDLKSSISSVWKFNPEFFDYPPISFDQEGSVTWARIVKENILQPFLPKNRLILQHIMRDLKEEEMHMHDAFGKYSPKDQLSFLRRKSNILSGGAVNSEHLERFLSEIQKKMGLKSMPVTKHSKARKFEVRAMEHVTALLRKKAWRRKEQEKKDLCSHKLFDLNLSLEETRKEWDYFKVYSIEQEVPVKKKQKKQRNPSDIGLKVVTTLPGSMTSIKESFSPESPKNQKEMVVSQNQVRRKSCCCSDCGGLSNLGKKTIDLGLVKEELAPPSPQLPVSIDRNYLHSESATLAKDRLGRSNASRDQMSTPYLKARHYTENPNGEKLHYIKGPKTLLDNSLTAREMRNIEKDRRRSTHAEPRSPVFRKSIASLSRLKSPILPSAENKAPFDFDPQAEQIQKLSPQNTEATANEAISPKSKEGDVSLDDELAFDLINEKLRKPRASIFRRLREEPEEAETENDLLSKNNKQSKKPNFVILSPKDFKNNGGLKTSNSQMKFERYSWQVSPHDSLTTPRGTTKLPLLKNKSDFLSRISQPVSKTYRPKPTLDESSKQVAEATLTKLVSPSTFDATKKSNDSLTQLRTHKRNFTLPSDILAQGKYSSTLNALCSPRLIADGKRNKVTEPEARPTITNKTEIQKAYIGGHKKVQPILIPIQAKHDIPHTVLTSPRGRGLSPLKAALQSSPYTPNKNLKIRLKGIKPASISNTHMEPN